MASVLPACSWVVRYTFYVTDRTVCFLSTNNRQSLPNCSRGRTEAGHARGRSESRILEPHLSQTPFLGPIFSKVSLIFCKKYMNFTACFGKIYFTAKGSHSQPIQLLRCQLNLVRAQHVFAESLPPTNLLVCGG